MLRERRSQQCRNEISQARRRNIRNSSYKKEVPCVCTSEHGLHCNTMSAVHVHSTHLPPVGRSTTLVIPSTLRSLSEIPKTFRRNLRSIAMSFFLPCEHNNRKADRIAILNLFVCAIGMPGAIPYLSLTVPYHQRQLATNSWPQYSNRAFKCKIKP